MNFPESQLPDFALIIDRGLYYYRKLAEEQYDQFFKSSHGMPEWCLYLRSLAEVSEGMDLWFKSEENLKALSDAAYMDLIDLYRKLLRQALNEGEKLKEPHQSNVDHLKEKYFVYYPDGKIQVGEHRRGQHCYKNTVSITSKVIHQDEYSIIGFGKQKYNDLYNLLDPIAKFWRMDFRNKISIINSKFPLIVSYYECKFGNLPFPFDEISFDKY